jgi:long-chain fatty acid transport protein
MAKEAWILGGAALFWASAARASAPDAYGLGSRAAAMAGAVAADVADFSAGYYNPAGAASAPGIALAVGYSYNAQSLSIDGADNDVSPVHGLVGGLCAPGRLFGVPFGFALALHLPDDGISFLKARRHETPRWELYDARMQLLFLAATLAVRPLDWLEVGGGIGYLSATRGDFSIRGRANATSAYDSQLEHAVDADLTAVRYPLAGLRLGAGRWGSAAIVYRGESKLDLSLDANLAGIVDFAGIEVPLVYELEARTLASFTPQQVVFALSLQRIAHLHVNAELAWVDWSAYESPTARIRAVLDVRPPPGLPVELPATPAPTAPAPPGFSDRWVPRVGVEWQGLAFGPERRTRSGEARPLVTVPLRAGYSYEESPVPDQNGVTNLVDTDRHTLTVGAGVALTAPFAELPGGMGLDAHALLSILPEREVVKASPADLVGDYAASGTIVGGGATLAAWF